MPIFEVIGSSDPLGLWDTTPQEVSFSVGEENTPEATGPVYRVNFSDDIEASNNILAENLASFERMKAALDLVPHQLDGLVRRVKERQQKAAPGVSFALADLQEEPGLEGELLSMLAISDSTALGGTGPEGVSFGLIEAASGVLGQAREKFEALLEQANREILHLAWVEMKIAGQIIARTEVGWQSSNTFLHKTISAEQMSLHKRTLGVVSKTRNIKLRLLLTVAGGAAKMAVLMVTPGGAVLAVPAVYDYVKKILDHVKELDSIQSSEEEKKQKAPNESKL
jgi:hypothetical protein